MIKLKLLNFILAVPASSMLLQIEEVHFILYVKGSSWDKNVNLKNPKIVERVTEASML